MKRTTKDKKKIEIALTVKSSAERLEEEQAAVTSNNVFLTPRETLMKKNLDIATKNVEDYKAQIESLSQSNKEIQEQSTLQEQDNLEIIKFLQQDNDVKDHKIIEVEKRLEEMKIAGEMDKEKLNKIVEEKVQELKNIIREKDIAALALQGEIAQMKDFKKKKADMQHEIDRLKQDLVDSEHRHKEIIGNMEKKFIEEKIRLQNDADEKISSLALLAHKTAIDNITDTTKEVFKENMKMVEALRYHIYESDLLSKHNAKLISEMEKCKEEKELDDAMVREKIHETKQLNQKIKHQQNKIEEMEKCLSETVTNYEIEKQKVIVIAKKEIEEVKIYTEKLKDHLIKKSFEMKYIRKLSQHVLDQRNDLEKFFIDSLDLVRNELAKQQEEKERQAIETYGKRLNQVLQSKGLSLPLLTNHRFKPQIPSELSKFLSDYTSRNFNQASQETVFKKQTTQSSSVDIEDLSWKDRERVLRILFAKINGVEM